MAWQVTDYTLRLGLYSAAAYKAVFTPLLAAVLLSELATALRLCTDIQVCTLACQLAPLRLFLPTAGGTALSQSHLCLYSIMHQGKLLSGCAGIAGRQTTQRNMETGNLGCSCAVPAGATRGDHCRGALQWRRVRSHGVSSCD